MFSEQQIRLAARMYEMRDTAKRLSGDKYPEKVQEWKDGLRAIAQRLGISPVAAVPRICKVHNLSDFGVMWLTAAAIELAESEESGDAH